VSEIAALAIQEKMSKDLPRMADFANCLMGFGIADPTSSTRVGQERCDRRGSAKTTWVAVVSLLEVGERLDEFALQFAKGQSFAR